MFSFNVNFGGFGEQFETFDCIIEIDSNGNKQAQRIQAPRMMIEQKFISLVQEAVKVSYPVMIKLSRKHIATCGFTGKTAERELYLVYTNDAYGDFDCEK